MNGIVEWFFLAAVSHRKHSAAEALKWLQLWKPCFLKPTGAMHDLGFDVQREA